MSAKLEDCGAKIGGARKDLWCSRGLIWNEVNDMTDTEKFTYVKRDNIWPRSKSEHTGESEATRTVSFFKNEIRLCVYPKPKMLGDDEIKHYIESVHLLKDETDKVYTTDDIYPFYKRMMNGVVVKPAHGRYYSMTDKFNGVVNGNRFLKYGYPQAVDLLKKDMIKSGYGLTEREKLMSDYAIVQFPSNGVDIQMNDNFPTVVISDSGHSLFYYSEDCNELMSLIADKNICEVMGDTYLLLQLPSHRFIKSGTKEACETELMNISKKISAPSKKSNKRNGKSQWIPPQLSDLKRVGENYRYGADVTGKMLMDTFGFRAVEFGNWENARERQVSVNMSYDSFKDISRLLKIEEKYIGLPSLQHGGLGMAYGARGRSAASAHYEPVKEAINMTKGTVTGSEKNGYVKKTSGGGGSLGHEFGHAFDDAIAKKYDIFDGLASERLAELKKKKGHPKAFIEVMDTIRYSKDPQKHYTDYFNNSCAFDATYTRAGNGYWASNCEMFARAFACYLLDKSKEMGIRNDYLSGHAESCRMPNGIPAYPVGEERKLIDKAMDKLIAELKEIGFFHHHDWEKEEPHEMDDTPHAEITYVADCDGQLCFA